MNWKFRLNGEVLGKFLERVPDCAKALEGYSQDGNTVLLSKLDELLAQAKDKKGTWDETTVQ